MFVSSFGATRSSLGGEFGGVVSESIPGHEGVECACEGDMRYARPCRPVKPLETIWRVKARSEEQVRQRRVEGVRRVRRLVGTVRG